MADENYCVVHTGTHPVLSLPDQFVLGLTLTGLRHGLGRVGLELTPTLHHSDEMRELREAVGRVEQRARLEQGKPR